MASRTAQCPWCGAPFTGYGDNGSAAQQDANSQAAYHAMGCANNPANKE